MRFAIDANTKIVLPGRAHSAVRLAAESLACDVEKVTGTRPDVLRHSRGHLPAGAIVLETQSRNIPLARREEAFRREAVAMGGQPVLRIRGTDPLGTVFGIHHVSRDILGIDPFDFWTGRVPAKRERVAVPGRTFQSTRPRVRYRGWFVNGEDCLIGWTHTYPPPRRVWRPVFETILRSGGNLVCAGTDLPRDGGHNELASQMGLIITHHHAEPLGAEFFTRAFGDLPPHYDKHQDRFLRLYREAVERQKHFDVVWTLGFRGSGDRPFWYDDDRYATPRARGEVLSRVIRDQYDLVRSMVPDAVFCTNLYGEMVALYHGGHLDIPKDVILVWGDNGYGAMVSRRQGAHDPRDPALPPRGESDKPHGVYYHVNFHDLQASNQLAMLQDPALVTRELTRAFRRGADDLVIVNSGNVRPHVLPLELVMKLTEAPPAAKDEKAYVDGVYRGFSRRHFGKRAASAEHCFRAYFRTPWKTARHPDARAGDELYHHASRAIANACLQGGTEPPCQSFAYLGAVKTFAEQVAWLRSHADTGRRAWDRLLADVEDTERQLRGPALRFLRDNVGMQTRLHRDSNLGLLYTCDGARALMDGEHLDAFLELTLAIAHFERARAALLETEHGKWKDFFRFDWLTGVRATIDRVRALRSHARSLGDPNDVLWKRLSMPADEARVRLAYIWRRPLSDDQLAAFLQEPGSFVPDRIIRLPEETGDAR